MDFSKKSRTKATANKGGCTIKTKETKTFIPNPDTVNQSGRAAYSYADEFKFVNLLRKRLGTDAYKGMNEQGKLIMETCDKFIKEGKTEFLTKAICYVRNIDDSGSRDTTALAAAYLAKKGVVQNYFYSLFDRKGQRGGIVFRGDDIANVMSFYNLIYQTNKRPSLTASMRKGFKKALESMDNYQIIKYWKDIEPFVKLVHPVPSNKHKVTVNVDIKDIPALTRAITAGHIDGTLEGNVFKGNIFGAKLFGLKVENTTLESVKGNKLETINNDLKSGAISKAEAESLKAAAKGEAIKEVIQKGNATMLSQLQNLRQLLNSNNDEAVKLFCDFIQNKEAIIKSRLLPFHFDVCSRIISTEFSNKNSRTVVSALEKAYQLAVPNMEGLGNLLLIVDISGSMSAGSYLSANKKPIGKSSIDLARFIAATFMKHTNCDVIKFNTTAFNVSYNPNDSLSTLSNLFNTSGSTNLSAAFSIARTGYDNIIVLSDNETNCGNSVPNTVKQYLTKCASVNNMPQIHAVDLALSGTTQVKGDNVSHYSGYGFDLFNNILAKEDASELVAKIMEYKF